MKIDYTKIATWFAFTYVTLDVIGILFLPPPNAAQVEKLINENQKLRSENQKNLETFKALYIKRGNEQNARINALEKRGSGYLPDVRGMKWK